MQKLKDFIIKNMFNSKGYIESQRIKQSWVSKYHPEIWQEYSKYFVNKEKFYNFTIKYKIIEVFDNNSVLNTAVFDPSGICNCGNKTKFVNIRKGYKKYCSLKCAGKYSVNIDKVKQTKLKKYGNENYNNPEKGKQTLMEKYGVTKVADIPGVKENQKIAHRKTNEESGKWVKLKDKSDYEQYKYIVKKLTEKNYKDLSNADKRGNHAFNKNSYHIDHIFPISKGFNDGILPQIIGSKSNIRMIPWFDNISKKDKITKNSKKELYERWSNSFV